MPMTSWGYGNRVQGEGQDWARIREMMHKSDE